MTGYADYVIKKIVKNYCGACADHFADHFQKSILQYNIIGDTFGSAIINPDEIFSVNIVNISLSGKKISNAAAPAAVWIINDFHMNYKYNCM